MEKYEKRRDKMSVWEDEGISQESMDKFQVFYDSFSPFINLFLLGYITEFTYAFLQTVLVAPSMLVRAVCLVVGIVVPVLPHRHRPGVRAGGRGDFPAGRRRLQRDSHHRGRGHHHHGLLHGAADRVLQREGGPAHAQWAEAATGIRQSAGAEWRRFFHGDRADQL